MNFKVGDIVSINDDFDYWMPHFIKEHGKKLFRIIECKDKYGTYKIETLNKEKKTHTNGEGIKKVMLTLPEELFKM